MVAKRQNRKDHSVVAIFLSVFSRVSSSHESISSRESSSSHESGSSQVQNFSLVLFFDYTNDVRAVTRNIRDL